MQLALTHRALAMAAKTRPVREFAVRVVGLHFRSLDDMAVLDRICLIIRAQLNCEPAKVRVLCKIEQKHEPPPITGIDLAVGGTCPKRGYRSQEFTLRWSPDRETFFLGNRPDKRQRTTWLSSERCATQMDYRAG
jgi:hypothetical protein